MSHQLKLARICYAIAMEMRDQSSEGWEYWAYKGLKAVQAELKNQTILLSRAA